MLAEVQHHIDFKKKTKHAKLLIGYRHSRCLTQPKTSLADHQQRVDLDRIRNWANILPEFYPTIKARYSIQKKVDIFLLEGSNSWMGRRGQVQPAHDGRSAYVYIQPLWWPASTSVALPTSEGLSLGPSTVALPLYMWRCTRQECTWI